MQLLIPFCFATVVGIIAGADWCYQSQGTCDSSCAEPNDWAMVAEQCGARSQSPINIVTRKVVPDGRLAPFEFTSYREAFNSNITNNGHTVQIDLPARAKVRGGDLEVTYKAAALHLHWGKDGGPGSEHTIDGERYPMELHIVHIKEHYSSLGQALKDPTGVAVLGFFYEESDTSNRKYDPIIEALNQIKLPSTNTRLNGVSLDALIPSQSNMTSYYRYMGSLTVPNCSQSVVWTVFQNTIPLSKTQLAAFSQLQFVGGMSMVETYRPVQPLNGRQVYRSGGPVILLSKLLLVTSVIMAVGV